VTRARETSVNKPGAIDAADTVERLIRPDGADRFSKLEECQFASLDVSPNSRCLVARRTAGRERSIGSAWRPPIADPDGITVLRNCW
jgi:hypothetical protein